MFCRNCGKELTGSPEFCMNCGARPMAGTSFCPGCGAPTTPMTEICTKCGAKVRGKATAAGSAWMPLTAGILDLLVAVPSLVLGIICAAFGGALAGMASRFGAWLHVPIGLLGALVCGPIVALSVIAIVGGVFAIKNRAWGFALAAAICACIVGLVPLVPGLVLGIPAIVFTVLGKEQFK